MSRDPFATLGLDARFDLDDELVEKRHRELSRVLHPDRHVSAPASERRLALAKAVEVNEAMRIVKDPIRRAEALLRRMGVEVAEGKEPKAEAAFLMQMMQEREALADAKRQRRLPEVTRLAGLVRARRDTALADLAARFTAAGFVPGDGGGKTGGGTSVVAPIVQRLGELRYYRRFLDEVSLIEDEIDAPRESGTPHEPSATREPGAGNDSPRSVGGGRP